MSDSLPEEISPTALQKTLQESSLVLIDCREQDEYDYCHIDGAQWIPLGSWTTQFPHGFPPRDAEVVVYCHHGYRSLRAVRFLRQQGYSRARSLAGGIEAWSLQVDPSICRY